MNEKKTYTVDEFVEAYGRLLEMSHNIVDISRVDFKLIYSGKNRAVEELGAKLRLKNAEDAMAEFMKKNEA